MFPPKLVQEVIRREVTRLSGRGGYHGQVGDQLPEQSPLLGPTAPLGAELAQLEPAEGVHRVAPEVPGPGGRGVGQSRRLGHVGQHAASQGALTLQEREREQQG